MITGEGELPTPKSRIEQQIAYLIEHGGGDITTQPLSVTENGTYTAPSGKAYTPVNVNVSTPEPVLQDKTVTENGTVTADDGYDGLDTVTVNVPIPPSPSGSISITENGTYDVTDKASAVVNVSGGGGGSTPEHGVFFLDYDGSIVDSWASSDVASKTALPSNPTHTGLVAQGWNWDLTHIKDYIAAYENADVYVGQMYKTASGLTEIDITVTKVTGLTVTCNMAGNKDWGDGTEDALTSHTYADYGDYTITCDGTSIPAGTSSSGGMFGSSSSNVNQYWCTAIRIGKNVTNIGSHAFSFCCSLTSIIIHDGVTSIGDYAFQDCYSIVEYDFSTSTSVPTLSNTNAFSGINGICKIIVPDALYEDWIASTNWSTYADYIYKDSEAA